MTRGRGARLVVVGGTLALVGLGVGAAAQGTLSYTVSPGEVVTRHAAGDRVRVTGTVVPGTLHVGNGGTTFVLSGDGGRTEVRAVDAPQGTFREGRDAVVEGRVAADGAVDADLVMARHANTYRADEDEVEGRR